ncbi:MAG: DUF1015 domain-containing protein [Actinomycetota bacterium]|nr:DUF1015 domain-containing protein [Actinomycetota bacterium]
MPRFEPFRGARYDVTAVALDQVIAPPYDVVSVDERAVLAARSPLNAIHLELPEPDPETGRDRYLAAADLLGAWRRRRVLVDDALPAFYPYRMTAPDGTTTTGVLGALAIGDEVLPHEETMPKPKSDRLDLLRATSANLSPIWGLSLTAGLTETFARGGLPEGAPAEDVHDDDGVRHQLWVLDDPAAVTEVREAVARSPVVIADGHHRYETARTYRDEVRRANGDRPGDHDLVMAFVVELAESQLHVRAIHRTVDGLPPGTGAVELLGRYFDAVHAGPATERVVGALEGSGSLAAVTNAGAWLLTPRAGAFDEAGTDLVAGLVDLAVREVPGLSVSYTARWQEALAEVAGGRAQLAIVLQPVTIAQISAWAAARRRMPPKTTYFSPKPRTGMVFRMLSSR